MNERIEKTPYCLAHSQSIFSKNCKRYFEIVFCILILILCAPLLLIVSLFLFFSVKGSIIYKHQRVGLNGKLFNCYKFRTMHPDADERLQEVLQNNPALFMEWQNTQKLQNDPRIAGKIGRFLRRTSLDEFPQFWNVLKGDLSLVGPRPLTPDEVVYRLGSKATKILSVKPGLTGIWQTKGRGKSLCFKTRIRMDEDYIEQQSFWLDLKLIFKTALCMIQAKGA